MARDGTPGSFLYDMAKFQQILWGYELTLPDGWAHKTVKDAEVFAATPEALESSYAGERYGQLMVNAEWNCARQPIEPIWTRHVGMVAGMLGARQVGSAAWRMGGGAGFEAEIVLPKRDNKRLWAGILMRDFIVLKFAVVHLKEERKWFEPLATQIISSLRFLNRVYGVQVTKEGLPLPPGYTPIEPIQVINDIPDPEKWRAYEGSSGVDAMQAFYLRELPIHGWAVEEYAPFPSATGLGFARLRLGKHQQSATLGLMPFSPDAITASSPAKIAIKYE